jgi:hypothetical protein
MDDRGKIQLISKVLSVVRYEPEQQVIIIRKILDDDFEFPDKLSKADLGVFMKED